MARTVPFPQLTTHLSATRRKLVRINAFQIADDVQSLAEVRNDCQQCQTAVAFGQLDRFVETPPGVSHLGYWKWLQRGLNANHLESFGVQQVRGVHV